MFKEFQIGKSWLDSEPTSLELSLQNLGFDKNIIEFFNMNYWNVVKHLFINIHSSNRFFFFSKGKIIR